MKENKKNNKKLYILIIAILVFILVFLIIKKYNNTIETVSDNLAYEMFEEEVKPVEWKAKYIWNDENADNSWMCFRKKFNIENKNEIKDVIAQITVDSKYWLYINDELVIREGAVKRGQKADSIYYDEVDLTKYLTQGENTISVLVWYWGGESMSHVDSGKGTFLFQTKIGNQDIITDDSWKVLKNPAYLQDEIRPNNRIVEYNVYYDASLEIKNWYTKEFNDSEWQNATIIGNAGDMPWGEMIKRNIPQFKNYNLKEYENIEEYKDVILEEDTVLEMKLPKNIQFMPYLKIEAPEENMQIEIKTDTYKDINGDSIRCRYKTKEGSQEFEMLPWINGEIAYYSIPKGIKIISLGYIQTSYDSKQVGKFESNDEFLNKLWQMSSDTLMVNMRDTYMDCPNRERAQWVGDMNIEMLEAVYSLDSNANYLYRKGIKTLEETNKWGILFSVISGDFIPTNIPLQSISTINAIYEYYQYTGDKKLLEEFYPYAKKYLELWNKLDNGLYKSGMSYYVWEWGDSCEDIDYTTLENAWYYLSLKKMNQIAEILGNVEDVEKYDNLCKELKESYNNVLWTKKGYKSEKAEVIDGRANALAVISGVADNDKYPVIDEMLNKNYKASPYMEYYVLESMCKMGDYTGTQKRIKDRYNDMVLGENSCSTLWENWIFENGTKNHAWSGGPLIIMSKYFAGITPLEAGYKKISIKPNLGDLNMVSSIVETPRGDIKLDVKIEENNLEMDVFIPEQAEIAIPKVVDFSKIIINDKKVYNNGKGKNNKFVKYIKEDNNFVYFNAKKGEFHIETE